MSMPTNRILPSYWAASRLMALASFLHGTHQLAKKSTTAGLPFSVASVDGGSGRASCR